MKSKQLTLLWAISLFAIGIATIVLAGSNLIGIELPDTAVRIIGLIDLIALAIFGFSAVKKAKAKE